ncbi:hypothetical protein GCM10017668_25180 [Streptomyces tuirus]|uniref:Uncharacterized protein n=1 Tax=Streptomyces tuirus TaxID=68278 RepID=A0A7G1NHX5_9ACTN|nr:hypothetical protein GCM10017668_25180 [Streptomyces tuirus]
MKPGGREAVRAWGPRRAPARARVVRLHVPLPRAVSPSRRRGARAETDLREAVRNRLFVADGLDIPRRRPGLGPQGGVTP